jgi:hypothetical protein
MSYSKQGVNYGIGALPTYKIDADLKYLRTHFDYIRITYPAFNQAPTSIEYWKDICRRARGMGFFVMWGITCPAATKDWDAFIQKFIDLAPWAATHGVVFGVNESLRNDLNIPIATAVTHLHEAARIAKDKMQAVKLHISLADIELQPFIDNSGIGDNGRGAFDFICLNQYDTLKRYKDNVNTLTRAYGTSTRITEFNAGRGFDPACGGEADWKADVQTRAGHNQQSNVQVFYIYTYDHNPEGNGRWNFRTGTNPETQHEAFDLFRRT